MKQILASSAEQFRTAQQLPEDQQRYEWFSEKISKTYSEITLHQDNGKIVYAECTYKIRFGSTKLYSTIKSQKGWSYDKTTQKVKVWFGTLFMSLDCATFIKAMDLLKLEWVVQAKLQSFITKGLLEKILQGKITNAVDACKYLIKVNRFPKNTSPKFMAGWIRRHRDRRLLYSAMHVAKDINHFLQGSLLIEDQLMYDCIKQCNILKTKIDFMWSLNRLKLEHTEWTRQIMQFELLQVPDFIQPYDLQLPEGFELIRSQRRLFEEGVTMQHCIYTNYLRHWLNSKLLVLHYGFDKPVTISLNKSGVDQMYHKRNECVSDQLQDLIALKLRPYIDQFDKLLRPSKSDLRMIDQYRYAAGPREMPINYAIAE